jgi:archaellum component FlaC
MPQVSSQERRVVELVLKATGDAELKRMTSELTAMKTSAQQSQKSLDEIEASGRRLGNTIRTLTTAVIGRSALGAFGSLATEITNTAKALGDLDDASAGGSKQFAQYSKAAQEFNQDLEDLKTQFGDIARELTAGMLPAMITLVRTLTGATTTGTDFVSVGKAIGDVLVSITANASGAVAYLNALRLSVEYLLKATNEGKAGFGASLQFKPEEAESHFRAAADFGKAAATYFENASTFAAAAKGQVEQTYRTAQKITGLGKRTPDDDGGKGGRSPRAKAAQEDNTWIKALTASLKAYQSVLGDVVKAELDQQDALAKSVLELNRAADPLSAYLEGELKLSQAYDTGQLTAEAYAVELQRLGATYDDAKRALEEMSPAFQAHQAELEKQAEATAKLREQWGFVADAFGHATDDIISGSESAGRAVMKLVATIVSELVRLEAMKLAKSLFKGLFKDAAATGGVFDHGVRRYQAGGIIGGPTVFGMAGGIGMAGEAGPEMIAPLKRDASGNMGVGAVAPQITVNNYAGADVQVKPTDNGVQIDILRKQIADDIRRGGNQVSSALEKTYRVGRFAGAFG